MRRTAIVTVVLVAAFVMLQGPLADAKLGDILKGLKGVVGGQGLSEARIVDGLKEALTIGTSNAVTVVSRVDGYYGNPKIRIPLPENVQKAESILRTLGYGRKVDEFELSMNRAAEHAAPEAKALFVDAIKQMSIADARKILEGRDNEATLYFKDKTHQKLEEIFKPIVRSSMSAVGVTSAYQSLDAKVRTVPFAERWTFDLDQYVTDKSLDGVFLMVAEEERKIRTNPAARVTDLLRDVFGSVSR